MGEIALGEMNEENKGFWSLASCQGGGRSLEGIDYVKENYMRTGVSEATRIEWLEQLVDEVSDLEVYIEQGKEEHKHWCKTLDEQAVKLEKMVDRFGKLTSARAESTAFELQEILEGINEVRDEME